MDAKRRGIALSLSFFVMPGTGHWYLGHRRAGGLFVAATLIALLYPLVRYVRAMTRALSAMAQATPDQFPSAVSALHQAWQTEYPALLTSLVLLCLIWIVAVADVWRRTTSSPTR